MQNKKNPEKESVTAEERFNERQSMFSLLLVLLPFTALLIGYGNVAVLTIIVAYFMIMALALRFATQLIARQGNRTWISEALFRLLVITGKVKRGLWSGTKKKYADIRHFAVYLFFGNTAALVFANFKEIFNAIDTIARGGSRLSAVADLVISVRWGEGHLIAYAGILLVLVAQKLPNVWSGFQRRPGALFAAMIGTFVILGNSLSYAINETTNGAAMILTLYLAAMAELAWILKTGSEKSVDEKTQLKFFNAKYAFGFAQEISSEAIISPYESYKRWFSTIERFSQNWSTIPYLLDAPITSSLNDKFQTREVAEKLYRYVFGIKLDKNFESSIIVGLDGGRGSGKTSVINMLKTDYLNYAKEKIPYFEFRAWSYPKGTMTTSFLSEFATFCNANGLEIKSDVDAYVESLSKLHGSFGAIKLFLGSNKTNSELIASISRAIRDSKKKIVVLIDDIDRICDKNDLEDLLKLLRSTANFYGVIYLLNYSSKVLLNEENAAGLVALRDFETKFLNWKVKMPEMEAGKNGRGRKHSRLLMEFIETEVQRRGGEIMKSAIQRRFGPLSKELESCIKSSETRSWASPTLKKAYMDSLTLESGLIQSYLENSLEDLFEIETIDNPRKAKRVINECLRLLDEWDEFEKCFVSDAGKVLGFSHSIDFDLHPGKNQLIQVMRRGGRETLAFGHTLYKALS